MDFLCLDFINSRHGNESVSNAELLASGAWLGRFCRKWGLPAPAKGVSAILAQLREAVDNAAHEYSQSGRLTPQALAGLNAYLEPVLLHNRLEQSCQGFRLSGLIQKNEAELLPYRVVMSFAELLSNYEPSRLKICENPDCGWIFYDESKSRTRRWCDNTCASLIKVRRFREKLKDR